MSPAFRKRLASITIRQNIFTKILERQMRCPRIVQRGESLIYVVNQIVSPDGSQIIRSSVMVLCRITVLCQHPIPNLINLDLHKIDIYLSVLEPDVKIADSIKELCVKAVQFLTGQRVTPDHILNKKASSLVLLPVSPIMRQNFLQLHTVLPSKGQCRLQPRRIPRAGLHE